MGLNLEKPENKSISKGEAGNCQVEGAS
jgi:hypothetical protein